MWGSRWSWWGDGDLVGHARQDDQDDQDNNDGEDDDLDGQAAIVSRKSLRRRHLASWAAFLHNIVNDDDRRVLI